MEDYQSYVVDFNADRDTEIAEVRASLSQAINHDEIMEQYAFIARGQLPRRLEMVRWIVFRPAAVG